MNLVLFQNIGSFRKSEVASSKMKARTILAPSFVQKNT